MKRLLISMRHPEECRVAVMDGNRLEEFYHESSLSVQAVGNIYKGTVVSVQKGMQAAFIDYGAARNGFLHASDVMPAYAHRELRQVFDPKRALSRREVRPIQVVLRRGQEVAVQVLRDAIDQKGAGLTTYLSIPGRYLVLMPGFARLGVSKRITGQEDRNQLKEQLKGLNPPPGLGFIIRTAGTEQAGELKADLRYLLGLWRQLEQKIFKDKAPAELYHEQDLVIRAIRDVYSSSIREIVVDSEDAEKRARQFLRSVMPRGSWRIHRYGGDQPLFDKFRIETEVEKIHQGRVALPSGGSIVIEQTEALVAVDVNSGKFTQESDPEELVFKTNLEAVEEIARQLRLRDLGGIIVCDLIDMRSKVNIRQVEDAFEKAVARDRSRIRLAKIGPFGTIELTRQRMRASLERTSSQECSVCGGTGRVRSVANMGLKTLRDIRMRLSDRQTQEVEVLVHPDLATYLQNERRKDLAAVEEEFKKRVVVRPDLTKRGAEVEIRRRAGEGA
jgi:ribonuclease E